MITINLEKLMTPKINLVRQAIKAIDERHHSRGTYEGNLTDVEAVNDYTELLNALPKMPGLNEEEIQILSNEINEKITIIREPDHFIFLGIRLEEEKDYYNAIDYLDKSQRNIEVEKEHNRRYDASYVEILYNKLKELVNKTKFSEEVKAALQAKIDEHIKNIPQVEKEVLEESARRKEEYEKHKEEYHNMCLQAFEDAKERYSNLSNFEKIKLKMEHKSPEYIDAENLKLEDIQRLYK